MACDDLVQSVRNDTWKPRRGLAIRSADLLAFFADRLKVHLREKGARHDLIDAVFSLGGQDDLALIVKRVEALGEFLKTDDGANLLIGVRRAINIVRDEEKKDKRSYAGAADPRCCASRRRRRCSRPSRRSRRTPPAPSTSRTSPAPCARWPSCAPLSMPSSTR